MQVVGVQLSVARGPLIQQQRVKLVFHWSAHFGSQRMILV
jgi:hypothetical protein